MTWKQLALWILLVDFAAFTAYAIYTDGYFAFLPLLQSLATGRVWGAQMTIDFFLALAIALGFIVVDARRRGGAVWPYVALTLTLGSIGPLAYLLVRERSEVSRTAAAHAPAHA